jgi:hypothetical protein
MEFGGQGPWLQRMQFISARKCNLHPKDLLNLDQVLVHVICQRWHIAAMFANKRIIAPGEISGDRLRADADDKVPLLWFRRRPGCPLDLYLNEVVHQFCGVAFKQAASGSLKGRVRNLSPQINTDFHRFDPAG